MAKHFLHILDMDSGTARKVLDRAREMKQGGLKPGVLAGKTVAMIFEKASTRTRVSFEVAIRHLGGELLFMTPAESQLGRGEPIKDTARVLSRYVDALVVRTFSQTVLEELAEYGSIPVVNALSDSFHPCQVMSDMLTMLEHGGDLAEMTMAWIGDGNNMANSFINATARFPFTLKLACPDGYLPDDAILAQARELGGKVQLCESPQEAVAGADFVHTDVWASMGQEGEQRAREKAFAGYMVDDYLMALAAPHAKFMHCLPAHRDEEVSEGVFEGPASIVWDQAENRLHMQKAILEWVVS